MTAAIRLCLPCPAPRPGKIWGDWYFGQSLARSLEAAGRTVRVSTDPDSTKPSWARGLRGRKPWRKEIDLVIRGKKPWRKLARRPLFIWLISQPSTLTEEEIAQAEHIFVASEPYAKILEDRGISASFLPQCTDPALFSPDRSESGLKVEALFVGNRRDSFTRPVVDLALRTGREIAVWGRGWDGSLPPGTFRGKAIPNDDLGRYYASAGVVLNDHHPDMRDAGFVSNRVYDVLASGTPILTEEMQGIPADLRPALDVYTSDSFAAAFDRALGAHDAGRKDVADYVRAHHGFANRAHNIVEVIGDA